MDTDVVKAIVTALAREGARFKIVGGVALNLQGIARATQDLDLFIDPTEDNVARIRRALRAVFDDPSIDDITSADLAGEYPAVQYVPPEGAFHVDLLARLGEAFTFEDIETETRAAFGVPVEVATPRMLVRMKRGTVRPQDRADTERLRLQFKIEDE